MPLFFRYLRRRLLANKKFGKYLLYAIGEILILIAGILFALQVNNWNENQQDRVTEISILKAIKADLEQDSKLLQIDMDLHEEGIASSQIIIDHLENNRPYNDSLSYHFLASNYFTYHFINSGGIQTLRSLGVNIITNEKLRNQIIALYDVQYPYIQFLGQSNMDKILNADNIMFTSRFDQYAYYDDPTTEKENDGRMIPLDYERLKNDVDYKYHLKTYKNLIMYYMNDCHNTKSQISQLILSIVEELKMIEK